MERRRHATPYVRGRCESGRRENVKTPIGVRICICTFPFRSVPFVRPEPAVVTTVAGKRRGVYRAILIASRLSQTRAGRQAQWTPLDWTGVERAASRSEGRGYRRRLLVKRASI